MNFCTFRFKTKTNIINPPPPLPVQPARRENVEERERGVINGARGDQLQPVRGRGRPKRVHQLLPQTLPPPPPVARLLTPQTNVSVSLPKRTGLQSENILPDSLNLPTGKHFTRAQQRLVERRSLPVQHAVNLVKVVNTWALQNKLLNNVKNIFSISEKQNKFEQFKKCVRNQSYFQKEGRANPLPSQNKLEKINNNIRTLKVCSLYPKTNFHV